ncbi:Nitrosoguanidine resistance SNG1 [Fusarium albosuccineum]|uniref:Nitrosoguanidine resistance SNG1 n=1 Tax=Fusarium albosuccineum TaxID=1237068 RepID=A0A8H4L7U4_9HYPO|nr:Nitrosoguanidine resistance SNG1 [Fusarium albosuccineum]
MADNETNVMRSSSPEPTLHNDPEMADIGRPGLNSAYWRPKRAMSAKILLGVMVAILVVFLADLSYLFGATFKVNDRVSALNILVVDYDGGPVGQAVSNAYKSLQSNRFPSLDFRRAADYPDPSDVKRSVCHANYWGALYIPEGTSDRLAAAYEGGQAAEDFDPTEGLVYIYNGARYPTVASGYLLPNFNALISATRGGYYQTDEGRSALRSINNTDAAAVQAYLNPIQGTPDIIRPTNQASRNLYNTLNIVMAILGQFFYVLAMNGIFDNFGIHKNMRIRDVWLMRFTTGKIFSMLFAVVVTGYIWAFREDWGVSGGHWALSWLTFWLFMDTNFQVLESCIGSFVPLAATPFFLLTWFMVNVSAVMFPFELMAGFYRIGYAFPGHSLWIVLIDVWSGCGNYLHIGLPILFAWWVVGHVTAFFSIRKRCLAAQSAPPAPSEGGKEE